MSFKWKTIRKERAHVLERKSTGADRGPGGAGDWSKKWMGAHTAGVQGASGTPPNLLKWRREEKKGLQKRTSVAKMKLNWKHLCRRFVSSG